MTRLRGRGYFQVMRVFAVGAFLLFIAGCSHDLAGPSDLSGTWAAPSSVPGSGFQFTLNQVGDSVFGSGTYAIEAGRNGTVAVAGRYDPPSVQLRIVYDYGLRREFTGQLAAMRMVGIETDSLGTSFSAVFVRRQKKQAAAA